ncbi:ABC transporter substrate-binding protein [Saccharopolyspora sp. 5N708]|uniref:ABC transporter substrate-binding protein n=1 Tax=Saccharopolyspora sp. 5N708 TaxID=3457424 RepID=UPI003FD6663D
MRPTWHGSRRAALRLAAASAAAVLVLSGCGSTSSGDTSEVVIAEPAHSLGYLPLYVGIDRGIFAKHGLDVRALTLQGGAAHTNAVLSRQAWGFIGGPEHNGFVQAQNQSQSASIKAVVNVVNRGNVYFTAAAGKDAPPMTDVRSVANYLRGKRVVTGAYGGTPNSILRYVMAEGGLRATDLKLIEAVDAAAPMSIVAQGQADVAVVADPVLAQGVAQGVWQEPFFSPPSGLGPYAYSTVNVRTDTATGDGAATTRKFVQGMLEALAVVRDDRQAATEVAKKEFSNLPPEVVEATLQRAYADQLWEYSGDISEQAVATALTVVRRAGVLKDGDRPVGYADVVDPEFVRAAAPK